MRRSGRLLLLAWAALAAPAVAQIPVSSTNLLTETFNTLTGSNLPTGWKMSAAGAGASAGWGDAGNFSAVTVLHNNSSTVPAAGRIYWQADNSSGATPSIGFLTSGSYGSPNAILACYRNQTGALLTGFRLIYNAQRRITSANTTPSGSPTFEVAYSTDGTNWTSLLPVGAWNSFYQSSVPGAGTVLSGAPLTNQITGLSVPIGGDVFVRWRVNTLHGGVHWGFGLDTVSFQVTGTAPAQMHWLGDDTTRGGVGTWQATGGTGWSNLDADGNPGVPWDSSRTAEFGGEAAAVTVSGDVPVGLGATFLADGSSLSSGRLLLTGATRAANTFRAVDGVEVLIDSELAGTNGLTVAGEGTFVLNRTMTYTGGTDVAGGSLVLAGTGGVLGAGVGILGSGDVSVAAGATLLVNHNQAVPNASALRLATGGKVDLGFGAGAVEAVGALYLNGTRAADGTYGATGSGAQYVRDDYFTGAGLLYAGEAPSAPDTLYWLGADANRGGEGVWAETGGTAWALVDLDIPGGAWNPAKTAWFSGSEGAEVTVSGEVSAARGLKFASTSNLAEGVLRLTGATQAANAIEVASGAAASLATSLRGTNGFTKQGAGTLVLAGAMGYEGGCLVADGVLAVASLGQLGAGDVSITPAGEGAELLLENSSAIPDTAALRLNTVGGVPGKVRLSFSAGQEERVAALWINGVAQPPGTYGATGSGATTILPDHFLGTGRLRVIPAGWPVSYAAWASARGLDGDPQADFDADGVADALELLFGTDPKAAGSSPLQFNPQADGALILVFPRADESETAGLGVQVQGGSDLATWPVQLEVGADTAGSSPGVTIEENGTSPDVVTAVIPDGGASRRFGRVLITP